MTELTKEVLEILKCVECGNYLSCSPIILLQDGTNVCGNCYSIKEDQNNCLGVRNLIYENAAKHALFPCAYKKEGCRKVLPLDEITQHELGCRLRIYLCPTTSIPTENDCTWTGQLYELKKHYEKHHSQLLLDANPFQIHLNISEQLGKVFLVELWRSLFIIQVQCSPKINRIVYCVRFFGTPYYCDLFEYIIDTGTEMESIRNKCDVESTKTFSFETGKHVDIEILKLNTINSEDIRADINIYLKNKKCVVCGNNNQGEITLRVLGYVCSKCSVITKCLKLDCNYSGPKMNMKQHEKFLCPYAKERCSAKNCKKQSDPTHRLGHEAISLHTYSTSWHGFTYICKSKETEFIYIKFNTSDFIFYINFFDESKFVVKGLTNNEKSQCMQYRIKLLLLNPFTNHSVEMRLPLDLHAIEYDWCIEYEDDLKNQVLYYLFLNKVKKKHCSFQIDIEKIENFKDNEN